jgi:hypothetical protein
MQKSEYKGVGWSTTHEKWFAEFVCKTKTVFLGFFTDPAKAALVYDTYASEHGGRKFNFPEYVKVTVFQKEEESRKKRRQLAEEMCLVSDQTRNQCSPTDDEPPVVEEPPVPHAKTKVAKLKNVSRKKVYTSKYRGVSWNTERKGWKTTIQRRGKKEYVGKFRTAEEAALAYNKAAMELFKGRAILNQVDLSVQTLWPDHVPVPSKATVKTDTFIIEDIERDFEELGITATTNNELPNHHENDQVLGVIG